MNVLHAEYPPPVRSMESAPDATTSLSETFQFALEFIRRQYPVIAVATAIAVAMGIIYLATARPSYTAAATMLIDTKNSRLFQQQSAVSDSPVDTSAVESQVEIIKSEIDRFGGYQKTEPYR